MPFLETTPLLKVDVAPRRHRYPHHALRRVCTYCLLRYNNVYVRYYICWSWACQPDG